MKNDKPLTRFLKGCPLGTGLLPGVSVGTVGIIVEIFDQLIETINNIVKEFKKSFFFLLPIALGVVISGILSIFLQETLYSYDNRLSSASRDP